MKLFFSALFLLMCQWGYGVDWLIIANGAFLPKEHIGSLLEGRRVLVLDGAANQLKEWKMIPDVILGDFDSIETKEYWGIRGTFDEINAGTQPYKGNFDVTIVPMKNQDYTDLEKGIMYIDEQGEVNSIIIANALNGKRTDHTLGNMGLLRKYYSKKRPIFIVSEAEKIEFIKDGVTKIRGNVNDYCAILGYPEAKMTTAGLMYNGTNYSLIMGIQESVCNRLNEPEATVTIEGEALVIHPYYFEYLKKE